MSHKITEKMGLVTATITVTNLVDEILKERGFITDSDVRSITLENVIFDTGPKSTFIQKIESCCRGTERRV